MRLYETLAFNKVFSFIEMFDFHEKQKFLALEAKENQAGPNIWESEENCGIY